MASVAVVVSLIAVYFVLTALALWFDFLYFRVVFLALVAWQILLDRSPETRGGRPVSWVRRIPLFQHVIDYFPIEMVVEEPLDASKPHIIAAHPHGIIGVGVIGNFAYDPSGQVARIGLDYRVCTVGIHFQLPLWREFIMALGFVDVSRASLNYLLGSGRSAVVVLGGAQEALEAKPGVCRLVVEKRRGIIRMALAHGARLVPCYTWGENELWGQVDNPEGSWLRWGQEAFKTLFKWSPVVIVGRGMFQYSVGILPFRRRLTTVLGKPLEMPRIESPTREQIEEHQKRYIEALQALYERHNSRLHEETDPQGRRVSRATFEIVA
ncbi:hypothetical protein FNF31_03913 [Cafeteria roenbergensis]|nr:hypothetical protein FNF31_03913 [Cafeteria roenbergensis]